MTTRDKLQTIAINLWWSWSPEARSLFRRLNPEVYRTSGNNPQAALTVADEDVLEAVECGVDRYIILPFDEKALAHKVGQAAERMSGVRDKGFYQNLIQQHAN